MSQVQPAPQDWERWSRVDRVDTQGRKVVDQFGDVMISAKLTGDGWRTRHTQVEKLIIKK